MKQNLGIGLCAKNVTFFYKLFSYGLIIVNLAIEYENLCAVLVKYRLAAAVKVYYTQATESERNGRIHIVIVLIGAAMTDAIRHILYNFFVHRLIRCVVDIPYKTTHILFLPLFLDFLTAKIYASARKNLHGVYNFAVFF